MRTSLNISESTLKWGSKNLFRDNSESKTKPKKNKTEESVSKKK